MEFSNASFLSTYAKREVFAYKTGESPECTNKMLSSFFNFPFRIKSISPATALSTYKFVQNGVRFIHSLFGMVI